MKNELVGKQIKYRLGTEGPFDRVGVMTVFGRKYHTVKHETGKTEYIYLDGFELPSTESNHTELPLDPENIDDEFDDEYEGQIKRGMKFVLTRPMKSAGASVGDVVTVTSVTAMGMPSDGFPNDYENIRVSNSKFSWRTDRSSLSPVQA